jgi:antitoxin (DNA-binding transcriptional repressor) of toxin-antitoxin stability system
MFPVMTTVTIHQAKTHLSRLIDRALEGEEIVVLRGRDPVCSLKPIKEPKAKRLFGCLPGLLKRMDPDFDATPEDFSEYLQ